MKDEIKSFLVQIKGNDDWKEIYNYITNLQEQLNQASLDIQELTERDIWCSSNCDKLTNLQEENERLKEVIENLTTMTICGDKKQIKNTAQFKLDQLRSKIDKAIYWIDEYCIKECEEGDIKAELRYVKDILKGEDNE